MESILSLIAATALKISAMLSGAGIESKHDIVSIAVDLGITAESLTAAGVVSAIDVEGVLLNLQEADEERQSYMDARLHLDSTGADLTELESLVRVDSGDPAVQSAYAEAVDSHADAKESLTKARQLLLETALSDLPAIVLQSIQTWTASSRYSVPAQFRTVHRSDEEWRTITAALRADRKAAYAGSDLSTEHAQTLALVSSEEAVVDAANKFATYLPDVKQAMNQFLGE